MQVVVVAGSPARDLYIQAVLEDYNRNLKGILFRGYVEGSKQPFGTGGLVVNQGDVIRLDSWGYASSVKIRLAGTLIRDRQIPGGWSGSNEGSLEGQGKLRSVLGTDPAVNTNISEVVPTGARWRLKAIKISLTTSGTVANRETLLELTDSSGNAFWTIASGLTQTGGQGSNLNFAELGAQSFQGAQSSQRVAPIPTANTLLAGWKITTNNVSLNAGDDYAAPRMMIEDWIEV